MKLLYSYVGDAGGGRVYYIFLDCLSRCDDAVSNVTVRAYW